ncbi:hypothetical protein KC315_g2335 [Hortaea werneckii]|nr:hypothetical protein KC315_g2335 [Hortaea werneckii]
MSRPEDANGHITNHEIEAGQRDGLLLQEKTNTSPANASYLRHALTGFVEVLKPEILQRRRGPVKRPGPTAFLDGLRGWAAFCVALMHLFVYTHDWVELCYNAPLLDGSTNSSPLTLPFIRLPFTGGHFSVMLFFVISGYVVPRRLLMLLHEERRTDFIDALQSAVIRRPVRLFIPVILSTGMFWSLFWHILGIATPWPVHQPTFFGEFYVWFHDLLNFVNPWRMDKLLFTYYNIHSWTIPVEYRGSMFIIVWLLCTSSMTIKGRLMATAGLMWYLVFGAPAAMYATFFAGMVTAELDLLSSGNSSVSSDGEKLPHSSSSVLGSGIGSRIVEALTPGKKRKALVLHLMLAACLWLASIPASDGMGKVEVLSVCPGWMPLGNIVPHNYNDGTPQTYRWFWLFWAAWGTLIAVKELPWLRSIFETPPMQYLGRHSFALYLIHGPMIGLLSERLFILTGVKAPEGESGEEKFGHLTDRWINSPIWPFGGKEGWPKGLEPNFWFCVVISLPVFLYVAEVGTRTFDTPSVKIARWVDGKMRGGGSSSRG